MKAVPKIKSPFGKNTFKKYFFLLKKPSLMLADFETAAPSVMFFNCSFKVFPVKKLKVHIHKSQIKLKSIIIIKLTFYNV
jgi:hypothetical protein